MLLAQASATEPLSTLVTTSGSPLLPVTAIIVGIFLFVALMIGVVILKGYALWRAARNGHKGWFIACLVINTLGILEIIYLLTAGKKPSGEMPVTTTR